MFQFSCRFAFLSTSRLLNRTLKITRILTLYQANAPTLMRCNFLKHTRKLTIFGTYSLDTFKHNTLINELLLMQFCLFNTHPKLHYRKLRKLRVTLFRTFSTSPATCWCCSLSNLYPETYKLSSVVIFTLMHNFDQNFVFFTERSIRWLTVSRVIFKIRVIFGVLFERRKIDKKAHLGLHENWSIETLFCSILNVSAKCRENRSL